MTIAETFARGSIVADITVVLVIIFYRPLKNYCGGHLRRCAVLATSPNYLLWLGCCATCALHLIFLMTFFKALFTLVPWRQFFPFQVSKRGSFLIQP